MPIDGSGNFSLPAGYIATAGTTILTTQHNPIFEDVATALTACVKANGSKVMTGLLTLSGDPSTALQAATKQYVDAQALAAVAGLDIKPSVTMASTGNVALTAEQTIDGVLTSGSRILLKNQTAPAENGIWLTGSGAWSRVTDMDAWTEVPGAVVVVESGTLWADTVWMCTANTGGTINTTAITWRRIDNQPLRNAQVGTTYTVTTDDHGRHITTSNGSAIATTLPQATTSGFGNGFEFLIENLGAGANTITPTTSTINGAATLILRTGDVYKVTSDGTNYRAVPHGLTYAQLTGLTEDATPDGNLDFLVTADASALLLKKVRPQNAMTAVALAKTGNYTVTDADRGSVIRFSGLASDATLTLPAAANRNGFLLHVTNEDTALTAAFGVIIDPNGAELIDGFATRKGYVMTRVTICCDGTGWRTVGGAYRYFSSNQTITVGGTLTLAHGLGRIPSLMLLEWVCTTGENGYTAGDILADPGVSTNSASDSQTVSIVKDATNLTIRYNNAGFQVANKTTGASAALTVGNWAARFTAVE